MIWEKEYRIQINPGEYRTFIKDGNGYYCLEISMKQSNPSWYFKEIETWFTVPPSPDSIAAIFVKAYKNGKYTQFNKEMRDIIEGSDEPMKEIINES